MQVYIIDIIQLPGQLAADPYNNYIMIVSDYSEVQFATCIYSHGIQVHVYMQCSLAGLPLLTQKARKGLVNEITSACPQVEHTTYQ